MRRHMLLNVSGECRKENFRVENPAKSYSGKTRRGWNNPPGVKEVRFIFLVNWFLHHQTHVVTEGGWLHLLVRACGQK